MVIRFDYGNYISWTTDPNNQLSHVVLTLKSLKQEEFMAILYIRFIINHGIMYGMSRAMDCFDNTGNL